MDMDIGMAMTKIVDKLSDLILCWIHVTTALIRPREHVEEKLCTGPRRASSLESCLPTNFCSVVSFYDVLCDRSSLNFCITISDSSSVSLAVDSSTDCRADHFLSEELDHSSLLTHQSVHELEEQRSFQG